MKCPKCGSTQITQRSSSSTILICLKCNLVGTLDAFSAGQAVMECPKCHYPKATKVGSITYECKLCGYVWQPTQVPDPAAPQATTVIRLLPPAIPGPPIQGPLDTQPDFGPPVCPKCGFRRWKVMPRHDGARHKICLFCGYIISVSVGMPVVRPWFIFPKEKNGWSHKKTEVRSPAEEEAILKEKSRKAFLKAFG